MSGGVLPAIVGVGESDYSRASGRSVYTLAMTAITAAIADSGLDPRDVDGIIAYPGEVFPQEIATGLDVRDLAFTAQIPTGGAAPVSSVGLAAMALETGQAKNVIVYAARNGNSGKRIADRVSSLPAETVRRQLEYPFGWSAPGQWYAMICRRHMHEYGTTRQHLGAVALQMRSNAMRNPRAVMHNRPMTMDDYLSSELIASPYHKLDCSLETDGAAAVLLTTAERARNLRKPPVVVAGHGSGFADSPDDLSNRRDWLSVGITHAAPRAFRMADTTPAEIDAAMIYDCFTFELLHQLEEAGFCPRGEAGAFILDGNIAPDGLLPVNTHGGLLSEGHMLGVNHIIEAVRQLRHELPERQIANAEQIVVTGWGALGDGSISVLRKVA